MSALKDDNKSTDCVDEKKELNKRTLSLKEKQRQEDIIRRKLLREILL